MCTPIYIHTHIYVYYIYIYIYIYICTHTHTYFKKQPRLLLLTFPLTDNFQTEIWVHLTGKQSYISAPQWPGEIQFVGFNTEKVRFSMWITSDKERVFKRCLSNLLIPDRKFMDLSRPWPNTASCVGPVPSLACLH